MIREFEVHWVMVGGFINLIFDGNTILTEPPVQFEIVILTEPLQLMDTGLNKLD